MRGERLQRIERDRSHETACERSPRHPVERRQCRAPRGAVLGEQRSLLELELGHLRIPLGKRRTPELEMDQLTAIIAALLEQVRVDIARRVVARIVADLREQVVGLAHGILARGASAVRISAIATASSQGTNGRAAT
jgi:hypothetical protein